MRVAGSHLTYCSNIHPGESWAELRAALERHTLRVRERVDPLAAFGLGLRLSALAAQELAQPDALAEFRAFLDLHGLYVFTINGFPYGRFHGARVKEDVYLPDWRDPLRLEYSNRLADLLAALLPPDPLLQGSVSTVPGAFGPNAVSAPARALIAAQLLRHVAHLVGVRERTGRVITLALEPEPCCMLETVAETVAYFAEHLQGARAAATLAEQTGLSAAEAERALREHLGVCLDLCHAGVEFEDPQACLETLRTAGIGIYKLQVTAGLVVEPVDDDARQALAGFADEVYLHQVVERSPAGLRRYTDLPEALAARPGPVEGSEWRVHFHVPLFRAELGRFRSTQDFVREVLALHRQAPISSHLEVETYTWDVLPPQFRDRGIDAAIADELLWVMNELQ